LLFFTTTCVFLVALGLLLFTTTCVFLLALGARVVNLLGGFLVLTGLVDILHYTHKKKYLSHVDHPE